MHAEGLGHHDDRGLHLEGTGAEVQTGDQLVANYYGIVWGGTTPFDNSYDRGTPAAFTLEKGQLINGFVTGLVGATVGSRVLVTVPPEDGYGTPGVPNAGIGPTDTLVFVIDILAIQ